MACLAAWGYCVQTIHFQAGGIHGEKKEADYNEIQAQKDSLEAAQKGGGIAKEKGDQQEAHHKEAYHKEAHHKEDDSQTCNSAKAEARRPAPIVEDTIVDVIDEPLPGVMRVTEIEEVSVALPDEGVEEEDKE